MLHTRRASPVSFFFHGSSDCSGQLAQTPWPTTRGRGLLRPDWVSLAVKSFNDLAQFFAIKNFSAARHIRVYTKHVHMLQLLHELFHLLLAVRAEAACATASASSWASRSGSSNTRRAGATAAASRSSWANRSRSCSRRVGASAASRSSWGLIGGCGLGAGLGLGARSWGLGRGLGGLGPGGADGGWGGGPEGGAGAGGWGAGAGAGAGGRGRGLGAGTGTGGPKISPLHVSIPSMSMCFSCFTSRSRLRNCQCKQLCQPKRIQQHPPGRCHAGASAASRSSLGLGWGPGGWGLGAVYGGREGGAGGGLGLGARHRGLAAGGRDRNWTGPGPGSGPCTGAGRAGAGGWDTAATHPRHTRTLRERLRTLRGRFANALATIPGQPLDPWTPTFKTGTLLLRIRENPKPKP